jgi:DNA polymerase/3'-5' exonuclease PolX
MLNSDIIAEFEKLISFIKNNSSNEPKEKIANSFRLKQLNNVLTILKKYPTKITLKNYEELKEIDGIGTHTIERIKEILSTGKLAELANFSAKDQGKEKILEELESVVGIGRVKSTEFYDAGITSVKMLKQKIKKGEIEVNEKIELGLKYYGVYQTNIPRKEIVQVNKILKKIIDKMNKDNKLNDTNKYIYEICGSFRRERPTSGDIDVLVSKLGTKDDSTDETKHLEIFINKLKENIKTNADKPLLVDDITDKNFETKYMGFAKYKENHIRRIDVRYVPYESFFSALLYFTGSAELNKKMRNIAKKMELKLSEYGLFKKDGTKLKIKSEEDFFKHLGLDFIEPKFR